MNLAESSFRQKASVLINKQILQKGMNRLIVHKIQHFCLVSILSLTTEVITTNTTDTNSPNNKGYSIRHTDAQMDRADSKIPQRNERGITSTHL